MTAFTKSTILDVMIPATETPVLVGFLGTSYAMAVQGMDVERLCRGRIEFLPVCGNPALYPSHGVRGLPTYILFYRGLEIGRHLGRLDSQALDSLIETALGAMQCPS
jgi:hypothetical protein